MTATQKLDAGTIQVPMCPPNPQGSYSLFLCECCRHTGARVCTPVHAWKTSDILFFPLYFIPLRQVLTKLEARLMASKTHRSSRLCLSLALGLQALMCGYTRLFVLIFKNVICTGVLPACMSWD